ncbi:DUF6404 family protein [Photobacterium damselae]|uniref:DUF6404 family protein n=1 Tax=Photobacterium damselae TaxID=38293 RepID=UPI00165E0AF1|nr:DUF6404 family protein [Photobacterium damselae]
MEKQEFINLYLQRKGVPQRLISPYFRLWSRISGTRRRPCLFEHPFKLFIYEFVGQGAVFYCFMWLFIWQYNAPNQYQLLGALVFALAMALWISFSAYSMRRKLNIITWEQWLDENGFDNPK